MFRFNRISAPLLLLLVPLAASLSLETRADIHYSTSTTAGTPSSGNVKPPDKHEGFEIGSWDSRGQWSFNSDGRAAIRFSTQFAGSALQNIGVNFLYVDAKKPTDGYLENALITWKLYAGTGTTEVATYTSNTGKLDQTGAIRNQYVNMALTETSGFQGELPNNSQFTLVLSDIALTTTGLVNGDSLRWNYWEKDPVKTGQLWKLDASGIGAGYDPNSLTGGKIDQRNLAFDMTAAPEPSTLILYGVATGGFFVFGYFKWKRSKKSALPLAA